jgi:hypothetical protein
VTNPARNEVEITIGEKTFLCRPTFNAIANIEASAGKSIFVVGQEVANGVYPMAATGNVLLHALRTSPEGKKLTIQDIGDMLEEYGMTEIITGLSLFCLRAFMGPEKPKREDRPNADPPT